MCALFSTIHLIMRNNQGYFHDPGNLLTSFLTNERVELKTSVFILTLYYFQNNLFSYFHKLSIKTKRRQKMCYCLSSSPIPWLLVVNVNVLFLIHRLGLIVIKAFRYGTAWLAQELTSLQQESSSSTPSPDSCLWQNL